MTDNVVATRSAVSSIVGLVLTLLGGAAMVIGFIYGIPAALDSSGSGAGGFEVLFLAGAGAAAIGLVLGIRGIVLKAGRAAAVGAVLVAVLLALAVLFIWIRANA